MKYYALVYKTAANYKEKRAPYRTAHFEHAQAVVSEGHLLLGGAMENPADEALLIFQVSDVSIVEHFAKSDPYVLNKVVEKWYIREWNVVVGKAFKKD